MDNSIIFQNGQNNARFPGRLGKSIVEEKEDDKVVGDEDNQDNALKAITFPFLLGTVFPQGPEESMTRISPNARRPWASPSWLITSFAQKPAIRSPVESQQHCHKHRCLTQVDCGTFGRRSRFQVNLEGSRTLERIVRGTKSIFRAESQSKEPMGMSSGRGTSTNSTPSTTSPR